MGLFDFLKSNKDKPTPSSPMADLNQTLSKETKLKKQLTGRQIINDQVLIQEVALAIIAEDPFVKPFKGQDQLQPGTKPLYEFEDVSTMNIAIDSDFSVIIEGINLGKLPNEIVSEIQPYFGKDILTAYVYVNGGNYRIQKNNEVLTQSSPYGLDIYLQFN